MRENQPLEKRPLSHYYFFLFFFGQSLEFVGKRNIKSETEIFEFSQTYSELVSLLFRYSCDKFIKPVIILAT